MTSPEIPASPKAKDPEMGRSLIFVSLLGLCFVWTLFTACGCKGVFVAKQAPASVLPVAYAVWLLSFYQSRDGRIFSWMAFILGAGWLWLGIEWNWKYAL